MDSLRSLAQGQVLMPKKIHTRSNGQVAARIFPNTLLDRLTLNGITAEAWMQPGVTEVDPGRKNGSLLPAEKCRGKVCLVRAAMLPHPPRDVLYRLYGLGHVVILKMSPINDYLGPIFEYIFAPFVQAGYLRFAYGGGDVGNYLVHYAGVQDIHTTWKCPHLPGHPFRQWPGRGAAQTPEPAASR